VGKDFWAELEGLQGRVTVLQATIGLLAGALRAVGVIGADTEEEFFALIVAGGQFAPTMGQAEWRAAALLGQHFARAVTLGADASLTLRP